jgi:hypothetical protein
MGSKNVILIILFLLAGLFISGNAQPKLQLLKGDKRIVYFKEGDSIRFKRSDRDHFTVGLIGGLTKDYFRIKDDTTYIYQLEKIDLSGGENSGFKTREIGVYLMTAGLILFFGDMINETVVNDNSYTANTGVIVGSSLLVGTGLIMQFVNNDNFVIGRRKKVVVLDN